MNYFIKNEDIFKGMIGGPKNYLPPEIIQNKLKSSMKLNWEKCDIYSLGIVIIECFILRNINSESEHDTGGIINFEITSNLLKKLLPSMVKKDPEERTNLKTLKKKYY